MRGLGEEGAELNRKELMELWEIKEFHKIPHWYRKMIKTTSARYLENYRILLCFDSGESGIVDLKSEIKKYSAAKSLYDLTNFSNFHLDEWPTLSWDCGFDLAPEFLYELATGKRPTWAKEN